jgi:hypothetical protein
VKTTPSFTYRLIGIAVPPVIPFSRGKSYCRVVVSSPFAPPRQRQNDAAKAPPVRAKPRLLSRHPLVGFGWRRELRRRRGIKLRQRRAKRIKARAWGNLSSSMARRIAAATAACSSWSDQLLGWPDIISRHLSSKERGDNALRRRRSSCPTFVILPCRSSARHAASAAVTMWRGSWRSMATPSCPICCRRSPIGRRGPSASMISARWSMRGLRRR